MDYSEPCQYSIRLLEKLESLDTKNVLDFDLINKAIYWAKKYHGEQKRMSGEPYYTHPLEVAYMISDYNLKTDVIVASILHDIVEDTEVTAGMILDNFGWRIAEMVDRLTRDRPDGSKLSIEEILYNSYINNDVEVILIKCMDRMHNMQTINFKVLDKQKKAAIETLKNFLILTESIQLTKIAEELYVLCNNLNCSTNDIIQKQNSVFDQEFLLPFLPVFENN
ncbi:MAG: bifunctional (p)ppGpp synthetase/guanosine-3',5'-bis(diphosphate) 3'-pyrophosphohydrolase [Rickettsiaceae bacterium]|nr:bifunctional (p)ppGpp synthetase/guanosine-3',5'-bis(diphosphate) 3'-pyrophosphohydrolase [Rickettsiaceae bacterium]